jgi:hypothetical protein
LGIDLGRWSTLVYDGKEPGSIYLEQVVVCLVADPLRSRTGVLDGPEAHRSRKGWRWWDRTIRLGVLVGTHKEHFVMKKFSKKGVLLFAGAMAVCAFAMPSMASAAS